MPDVSGGEHIVQHWRKCGEFTVGMNGLMPLTWQELQAYNSMTGETIESWEAEQIIDMSKAYVSFSRQADELNCFPPFEPEVTEEQEQEIKAQAVSNMRGALRRKSKKK